MKRYALIVGIGEYRQLKNLTKPANDAQAVHDRLVEAGDFQAVQLLNEKVTAKKLKDTLRQVILQQAEVSDLLLYFTGHGYTEGDEFEQTGFLATYDCEVTVEGETVVDSSNGVSLTWLNNLIKKANLSSLAMYLDCCESGFAIENALLENSLQDLAKKNCFFTAACRSFQKAYALRSADHSYFTAAFLDALQRPEQVTAMDVYRHIEQQLKGQKQEPVYIGRGSSITILQPRRQATAATVINDECPYRGLKVFDEAHTQFFFGREDEVQRLLDKLKHSNFVPVIGVSGSGKSSVVRAGLLPALRQMGRWRILEPIKPGIEPMAMLKNAFCQLVSHSRDVNRMAERISHKDLLGAVALVPDTSDAEKLLLVVDQFEEVFALGSSNAEKQQFIDCLTKIAKVEDSPLAIVTTMRADFLSDWLSYGELIESIQDDAVFLGRLQGQALLDAVEKPALVQGHSIENGLLQLIADDMQAASNALPLLEFALEALWDQRDTQNHCLTVDAYTGMDRLKGTLDSQATKVYDQLAKTEQGWCRRVCLSLIRIGKDGKDTRQRQPREKLLAMGETDSEKELIDYVIDRLVGARLLVTGGDGQGRYVDIAHEALMDGWRQFADWRQENRDLQRLGQRTRDAYEEWVGHGQHPDYLIPSGLLAELRELPGTVRNDVLLDTDLRTFFTRSDEQDQQQRASLEKALADAQIQNRSRKIRDKLINLPQYTVEATLEAMDTVNDSLVAFKGEVKHSAQYALNQTWQKICERLKLEGHRGEVRAVAFSPEGDRIVSGSDDHTLRLWDREGNPIGASIKGHRGSVRAVAFSPYGDRIVSGSDDHTLRLWDQDGNPIGNPIEGHCDSVFGVAFSPDGEQIISGGADHTLRLWDREGNPIGAPIEGHRDSVWAVAFSPDGEHIISGSDDHTLRLWDREGNPIGASIKGHRDSVWAVAFSPDGEHIISGSDDHTLRLWDLEGNPIGTPLEGHRDSVFAIAFSPDGEYIVSGGADHTLRLWDREGNPIGKSIEGHHNWVNAVAFSPDGECIVSGSADHTLRLWDREGNPVGKTIEDHRNSVFAIAFSPDGECIVSGGADHTLRLWDREGNSIGNPIEGHCDSVNAIAFSPDGERIVSSSDDHTLRLWDRKGNPIGNPIEGHCDSVFGVAFSPDGECIVSGSADHTLRLWDREGNPIGNSIEGHGDSVFSVAFSPDGECIVSGSHDHTLRLWSREGNPIGSSIKGHRKWVNVVAFSPDGERIVSGSDDYTLRLWDREGNPIGNPIKGHYDTVNAIAFSHDGKYIVSGSNDHTLRLWDREGNPIGNPIEGHRSSVYAVAFNPKGDRIVSVSHDQTLRIWDRIRWQDWLHDCCNQLLHHSDLVQPKTEVAKRACQVCMDHAWSHRERAEFLVAQGKALAYYQQDVDGAVAKFEAALAIDGAALEVEPRGLAEQIKGWGTSP